MALTMTGGTVDGWDITPFTDWDPATGVVYVEGDDTSPIDYPGMGYVPSPGGTEGEKYDIEWTGWKVKDNNLCVLAVSSFSDEGVYSPSWNYTYGVGDMFMDVDGDGAYDFAFAGSDHDNFLQGQLYSNNGEQPIDSSNGGYGSYSFADELNPWRLADGEAIGDSSFALMNYDYGGDEDGTYIWEWCVSLDVLEGMDLSQLTMHWTLECGNDLADTPPVPEPATVVLLAGGFAGLAAFSRRRRK
jgi:hypothetical protein